MNLKAANGNEARVVGPDFGGAVVARGQSDLQIEDSGPMDAEIHSQTRQSLPEILTGCPDNSAAFC